MILLIFHNLYECKKFFFTFLKTLFLKKKSFSLISRKILECNFQTFYKNVSKIRNFFLNVTFLFLHFEKNLKRYQKIEKIHMDSKTSINLFEMREA